MKAKLLYPYAIDMEHVLCTGTEVEIIEMNATYNGFLCILCICALSDGTVHAIPHNQLQIMDYTPHIDWEQIRIQAAIATMQNLCGCERFSSYSEEDIAKFSVKQADALIEQLKKKKK